MTIQGQDVVSFSHRRFDKTMPILVVEDEAIIALDTQATLNELGFPNVEICLDYAQSRSLLMRNQYGLVIFDINLGGNLTFGLINMARENGSAVITMSGYLPGMERVSDAILLSKPVTPTRLKNAIDAAAAELILASVF